ncbi:hypothetical protein [Streptomyces olivoreticuli]|uniref:hypothetical protein n=1 Tax=Streptomyces olivoreticuli TaxID=68246 RepID=UPI000E266AEC|nr:hypothetical protein [Streptomyces olivoreticuli]
MIATAQQIVDRRTALRAAGFGMIPVSISLIFMATRMSDDSGVVSYLTLGSAAFVLLAAITLLTAAAWSGRAEAARRELDRAALDALEPLRTADDR